MSRQKVVVHFRNTAQNAGKPSEEAVRGETKQSMKRLFNRLRESTPFPVEKEGSRK